MKIYNTLTRSKEEFKPSNSDVVRMYVCGPTVYNLIHIGNARVYVFFDVVRRFFEESGYRVYYVSNFTDIDDKIIKRASEEEVPFEEVARKYEREFLEDIRNLGLKHADVTPRATEHIDGMIKVIEGLVKKGYAYASGGDVYFSVEKFRGYGKLSGRTLEEMRAGERVEPSPNKKDPLDFALWKAAKPGEPQWPSPFGNGRPGWHIECSVMSTHYLGFGFDIHGGGQDLIFPHHENEIAQAEAYYDDEPFVKFWMHNGLLTVRSEKMAKSLGNIILLRDALNVYGPDVLKFFYLSTHYRSPLDYSQEKLREHEKALKKLYETVKRTKESMKFAEERETDASRKLLHKTEEFRKGFDEAMREDFNTARALGEVFEFIKEINAALDSSSDSISRSALENAVNEIEKVNRIFGIDLKRFEHFMQKKIKSSLDEILLEVRGIAAYFGVGGEELAEIVDGLIKLRQKERENKNYSRADEIRSKLARAGVILEDTPQGTRYRIERE